MATGGPLPFLELGGVEVANAARTLAYLRNGLGGVLNGRWELGPGELCGVLYRVGGGSCATPSVFVSPAADPAPWYDPTEPGSLTFLGFVLLDIQGFDSTKKRAVTTRMSGLGGGTLSAQYRLPRIWKFRGALISADDVGAEFGLRWLDSVLQASDCDTCDTFDMVVRLACPPADCSDDTVGEWTAYQSALTDGPNEVEPWGPAKLRADSDVLAGCRDWVTVEFTVASGNPFLYKRPKVCLPAQVYSACTDDPIPIVYPTSVFADAGSRQRRRAFSIISAPLAGISADVGLKRTLIESGRGYRGGQVRRTASDQTDACEDICTFLSTAKSAPCCTILPPERGVVGAIFTLSSATGYGAVRLQSRVECGDSVPLLSMEISGVAAGATVTVNCANHTISVTDALGNVTDGQSLIVLEQGQVVEWVEIASCESAACICVESLDNTPGNVLTIEIQTQAREG